MLVLSLMVASIDILFVGTHFYNNELLVSRKHLLLLFFLSLFIFLAAHFFGSYFSKMTFFPYLKSILFMWFGLSSLFKKESTKSKGPFILLISSYIDAVMVSISFLYLYPSYFLAIMASSISVLFFEIGYYLVRLPIKKRQQLIGVCYLIIALLSLL